MRATIVYVAGSRWNDVAGTDKRFTTSLAEHVDVLWVDPPFSALTRMTGAGNGVNGIDTVAPGLWRLQVRTPPGASRGPARYVAARQIEARVVREIRRGRRRLLATVVASPRGSFFNSLPGVKVLYATDDWIDGASMMGLNGAQVKHRLAINLGAADLALAVSPGVADMLRRLRVSSPRLEILPNGCSEFQEDEESIVLPGPPVAGLVGQLNERLDMDALEAVSRKGVRIVVVGPRTDREPEFSRRLDRFLDAPNVEWLGERPQDEIYRHLSQMTVGLTPYSDTQFNRASFPLKTLEYLAAGLPVVSTDLPAVRWLDTSYIGVSTSPEDFADKVVGILGNSPNAVVRGERKDFARKHTWGARASQFLTILGTVGELHADVLTS